MRLSVHDRTRPPLTSVLLGVGFALALVGCGPSTLVSEPPAASASPVEATTQAPVPTPVPGGVTPEPVPTGTRIPTTETDWGEILDAVPPDFPLPSDAEPADPLGGPASGAWLTSGTPDGLTDWYTDALRERGWSMIEAGGPMEDGSWTLDAWTDLPECRLQAVFRPAGDATMITVLYAAACVGG